MLHPADKHSSNGILRNTSYNHAMDSSLRISVRSFFHSDPYNPAVFASAAPGKAAAICHIILLRQIKKYVPKLHAIR
jgi:hypothetical protein